MSSPFLEFFYRLREFGVSATTSNWLAFVEALSQGLHGGTLDGFHAVARSILTNDESEWDGFDRAFLACFAEPVAQDVAGLIADLEAWTKNPRRLAEAQLDPVVREFLEQVDLEQLREQMLKRLAEQRERHEGGSKWIGTGGRSPFGQGGRNPAGVRIGQGGGRSALAVASRRQFAELRRDITLDTRQLMAALRRLRRLERRGEADEFDLSASIDATARMAGELEIVFRPPRANDLRVLLLLDVGGSMDPHAHLVSRLFSAAERGGGFRELRPYYFHNCVYSQVFEDASFSRPVGVDELLRGLDPSWRLIFVGDAWMHPGELTLSTGDFWSPVAGPSGIMWLARLADRFPHAAWLNPESERIWHAPTVAAIGELFPMYRLTIEGLGEMTNEIHRGPSPERRKKIAEVLGNMAR